MKYFTIAITILVISIIGGCNKANFVEKNGEISEGIENIQNDELQVILVEPESPASLPLGDKLNVTIYYKIVSTDNAVIWARPYYKGSRARGYKAHHSIRVQKNISADGLGEGWFFFDKPTLVDEVRVTMRDTKAKKNIVVISHAIEAQWIDTSLGGGEHLSEETVQRKKGR